MIDRESFRWPGDRRGAVSLTYDDAMVAHRKVVVPLLEEHAIKATFYVPVYSDDFMAEPREYADIAHAHHEIGNHTVNHPCWRDVPSGTDLLADVRGNGWRNYYYYCEDRLRAEFRVSSFVLSLIDGKTERTFGNTCCCNIMGPSDNTVIFDYIVPEFFIAARGSETNTIVDVGNVNYANLGHFSADKRSGRGLTEITQLVEHAVQQGHWVIFMIHGIGDSDRYDVDRHNTRMGDLIEADVHKKLIGYLSDNAERIWTAPVAAVAQYLKTFETPVDSQSARPERSPSSS